MDNVKYINNNTINWSLIVAVNDDEVLNNTLLRSPVIDERCEIIIKRGYDNIGTAYNEGIAEAKNEIMVFAHQDTYLPENWLDNLSNAINQLVTINPNWGVLGVYGVDKSQRHFGFVYSTGLKRILGHQFKGAIETLSLDELLLVIRRSSKLSFDDQLPGFHLYGTDICLEAQNKGMKNYIIQAFCIHNSQGINKVLPLNFWKCFSYIRKKRWTKLPLKTTCCTITRSWFPLVKPIIRTFFYKLFISNNINNRSTNIKKLYETLNHTYPEHFTSL